MWNFPKKLALAGISTLLAATASLFASFGNCDNSCNFNSNCNYNCNTTCCGDWSIEAEALLWRTNVDELPVGRHFSTCANPPAIITIPGDGTIAVETSQCNHFFTKYLDFDWRAGSRVTIGYKPTCYCWDFSAAWTWLHNDASASLSDDSPFDTSFIEPAWFSGITPPFDVVAVGGLERSRHIHGDWGLSYNTVELGFGYTFCACCDQFALRPHVDVKFASIRQKALFKFEREFTGPTVTGGITLPFTAVDKVILNRDFLGIGPQVGIDFTYMICGGLSFYAKAAAALLYGEPEIKFRGKSETLSDTPQLNYEDDNESERKRTDPRHLVFNSTLGVGFAYSKWVCDCCYRLTFKLGWEHQFYTDQNQFHRATFLTNAPFSDIFFPVEHGNLSLYGLTASIGLDY